MEDRATASLSLCCLLGYKVRWAALTFTSLHPSRYELHALHDRNNMLPSLRFALGNIWYNMFPGITPSVTVNSDCYKFPNS